MRDVPTSRPEIARQALRFARDCLGPMAERLLQDPEQQCVVAARVRRGYELEDAVLGVVFERCPEDPPLADEFLGYFLEDLLRLERPRLRGQLRRFLDTGDLVQSVLGDLWPRIAVVRFETRARFVSYLARHLASKATDHVRYQSREKRREDQRVDVSPRQLEQVSEESSILSRMAREEDRDRLILLLLRLPERDRHMLTMQLQGQPLDVIAESVDLSLESARKALDRARRRARGLAARSQEHRGGETGGTSIP